MTDAASSDILIGPRTTVLALVSAYPFIEPYLLRRGAGFAPLDRPLARSRWARVTTLRDVAAHGEVTCPRLVREVAAEVALGTGRPARVAPASRELASDDGRLRELHAIVAALEAGGSLPELAKRWKAASDGLDPSESAALDKALSAAAAASARAGDLEAFSAAGPPDGSAVAAVPDGHPLDTLHREADLIRRLCADLEAALDRLGGSPPRRRWRRERPLVARLVDRLGGVEARFRRLQQAWFPALAVHGVDGPRVLLTQPQADALELLRRVHLAVAGDDTASVAEGGARLVTSLGGLLAQDERVVEPLAQRHFSRGDWAAVRELEDGVEWRLVAPPPAWPRA